MNILIMNGPNQDFLISCKKRPNQKQYLSLLKKLSKLSNCSWSDFRHCYGEMIYDDCYLPATMDGIIKLDVSFPTKYRADILPPIS